MNAGCGERPPAYRNLFAVLGICPAADRHATHAGANRILRPSDGFGDTPSTGREPDPPAPARMAGRRFSQLIASSMRFASPRGAILSKTYRAHRILRAQSDPERTEEGSPHLLIWNHRDAEDTEIVLLCVLCVSVVRSKGSVRVRSCFSWILVGRRVRLRRVSQITL